MGRTAEQQIQGRERQRQEEQTQAQPQTRQPERERLSGPGELARALAEGASLWEMPPGRLEELAALMGNQGMEALLEQQSLPLEETSFTLPQPEETDPFPVPETGLIPTAQPPVLTGGDARGRAFDPAGLVY